MVDDVGVDTSSLGTPRDFKCRGKRHKQPALTRAHQSLDDAIFAMERQMPHALPRVLLSAFALCAAGAASAAPPPDAAHWQAMARADLDAAHATIVEAHPGVIDAANPGFRAWLEQGYQQAKAYLPYVVSYDTAVEVVRFYTSGFEDEHLGYSDDIRNIDFPVVATGWNVDWKDGRYVVASVLPGWSVPMPPVGSAWTGCDGLTPDDVLRTKVGPFWDRRGGEQSRNLRMMLLGVRRPVAEDLSDCTFTTTSGDSLRLPVVYRKVAREQFSDALSRPGNGNGRRANAFDFQDGVLWVRAGNFSLRENSGDKKELDAMLAGLADVRDVRAIVFDARGNRGGDSSIGDRIFEAATGGLEFDRTHLDALPRYYAQWRVSDYLVRYLDSQVEQLKRLYGADSERVAEESAFREQVVSARAAGQSWVEQDAGRTITRKDVVARHGHLRRFDAKVALLTDSDCVSACLDFADIVLQVPGMVHVGQTTGADSVYMVASPSRMPSGNHLVVPVKVWRNRARGNNEPLTPNIAVNLDQDEVAIRRDVLRALGME